MLLSGLMAARNTGWILHRTLNIYYHSYVFLLPPRRVVPFSTKQYQ